jgi:acyl carrier protein
MPIAAVTFEAVAARLGSRLAVPPGRLTPGTSLIDLAADSFELVELLIDLQEEFDARFTHAQLRSALTLGDLVDLLREQPGAVAD